MITLPLRTPATFFVRICGEKGSRILSAVLSPGSVYTVVPYRDAIMLGYEALYQPIEELGVGVRAATAGNMIEAPLITLTEVQVGTLVARNVEAVAHEIPSLAGVEVILGCSFLKNFKTTLDYGKGVLTIEEIG